MKYILLNILLAVSIGFLIAGCSELKDDISHPDELAFHKPGITDPHSDNFHGALAKELNWNLKECAQCHGADFSGGTVDASCLNCHNQPEGPEACNTCHGSFADPSRIAPPVDLNNNSETTSKTVGAHSKHLYDNTLGNNVPCQSCHNVPQTIYDPEHFDGNNVAEVNLKDLAVIHGGTNAAYDQTAGTCSNTYCHGSFEYYRDSAVTTNQFAYTADKMVGLNKTVDWTKVDQNEAECGSCHGLPPEGHISAPLTACYQCHEGVIDATGKIIDRTKHINGEKNARGTGAN